MDFAYFNYQDLDMNGMFYLKLYIKPSMRTRIKSGRIIARR